MLGVNERRDATVLLHIGSHRQCQRRLARGFRAKDLNDSSFGKTAATERQIEAERPGRHTLDASEMIAIEGHDRTLAMSLLNLREGSIKCLTTAGGERGHTGAGLLRDGSLALSPLGLGSFSGR